MNDHQTPGDDNRVANIEILDLADRIRRGWKTILLFVIVCFGFAFFHTKFGPTEYEAVSLSIQESDDSGSSVSIGSGNSFLDLLSGGMTQSGSLPAVASGQTPPPLFLYPSIVTSSEFLYELIHTEIEFEYLDESMTVYDYFADHYEGPFRNKVYDFLIDYTIKLPFTLLDHLRDFVGWVGDLFSSDTIDNELSNRQPERVALDDRLQDFTSQERAIMENLKTRIMLEVESGLIMLTTKLPDPEAAALLNAQLLEQMEEFLVNYRLEKARRNLENAERRYEEFEENFLEAQDSLASYVDSNLNASTRSSQVREENLQRELNVQAQLFTSIRNQLLQAELNLERETPIYQILDKPSIPGSPAEGYENLLLMFSIVIGVILGVGWIFVGDGVVHFFIQMRDRAVSQKQ